MSRIGDGESMSDTEFFTQLAKRCRRLAQSCFDLGVAGELREMAHELENRASIPKSEQEFREPGAPVAQRASRRPRRHE
jgi:hypothetical protein